MKITGWGKISSLRSVGHCEGSGGRRRVRLDSKGAGSWKVPVTTLRTVVKMVWSNEQRAFAVETYFSQSHSIVAVHRAFRTRYQIPPRDQVGGTQGRSERARKSRPHRGSIPDRLARSQSLYRLSYPAHKRLSCSFHNLRRNCCNNHT